MVENLQAIKKPQRIMTLLIYMNTLFSGQLCNLYNVHVFHATHTDLSHNQNQLDTKLGKNISSQKSFF